MKKLSKLLIVVLAVALICTGLIFAVSADETAAAEPYVSYTYINDNEEEVAKTSTSLRTAVAGASAGTVITLHGDLTLAETGQSALYGISVDKSLTIDLNGYSLIATDYHRLFNIKASDIDFTITGNGTIDIHGALIVIGSADYVDVRANIIGTGKGINITHAPSINVANNNVLQYSFISTHYGTFTFKNFKLTTTSAKPVTDSAADAKDSSWRHIFDNKKGANFIFEGVEITAGNSNAKSHAHNAVIYMGDAGTLKINYSKISSTGYSLIRITGNQTAKVDDYIVVDNSYLNASYGSGGAPSLIYYYYDNNWNPKMGSDIVINNSYVSVNNMINIRYNYNDSALILKNTTLQYNGSNSSIMRAGNIKLEAGSSIVGSHGDYLEKVKIYNNSDNTGSMKVGDATNVNLLISEGARFDANTYNKLKGGTGYEIGQIAYPDGSYPSNSETYKIIYDPTSNYKAPYVVVKAEVDGTDAAPTYLLYEDFPYYRNLWHNTGTTANPWLNNNDKASLWMSTGKKNSDGANPNFYYGFANGKGISFNTYNVIVFDIDIAADAANGFAATGVSLHSRTGTDPIKGDGRNVSLFSIASDGTVTYDTNNAAENEEGAAGTVKMSLGEWNHITIVIDTTVENYGTAYVYINGTYLVKTKKAYGGDDATFFGLRFDVNGAGVLDANSTIILDNTAIRGYGDGANPTALTDNGLSYLYGGGKPWRTGPVNNTFTVAGLPLADIHEALKLNRETGIIPLLVNNITHPVTVTENGEFYASTRKIEFTRESYARDVSYGADGSAYYIIDSAFNDYSVTYKYFLGTLESQKADPNYWQSVTFKAGEVPADYEIKLLDMKFNNQGNGTYLYQPVIGWASALDSTPDATLASALSADFVIANNGAEFEIYPAFDAGAAHKYHWLVKRADGSVRYAGARNEIYGTDWLTRGQNGVGDGDGSDAVKLEYGETFVVLTDSLKFAARFQSYRTSTADKVFNFDINGHNIRVDSRGNGSGLKIQGLFVPNENETINVYSSVPGASINCFGYNDPSNANNPERYKLAGGVFALVEKDNSVVNIGEATVGESTYPGSNLTIRGDQIARAYHTQVKENNVVTSCTPANNSSINIKGCTLVRSTVDMLGMFNINATNSSINVEDCTVILASGGDLAGSKKETYAVESAGTINFKNSTIITKNDNDNLLLSLFDKDAITFENCVTNGKINNIDGNITVKNTACFNAEVTAPEGYVIAKYNLPMTLAETISTIYHTTEGGKGEEPVINNFVVVGNGSSDEADLVLPLLVYKYVPAADAVEVTWNGLGTNGAITETYAKGGNVIAPEIAEYKLNFVKLVANGSFDKELATNIQESVVYTPLYDVEAIIEGLKANLSLYSDFMVNLYIPVSYRENIVSVNGNALDEKTVTINGTDYVKVVVSKTAKEATDAAVFEIKVVEGEIEATKTVNISITDYATEILAGEYGYAEKTLMYYMLNYVGEAAEYFEGEADATIAKLLEDNAVWNNQTVDKTYTNAIEENLDGYFVAAGVVLEDAPAYTLTFKKNMAFEGTVTVAYGNGYVRNFAVNKEAGEDCKLMVGGMKIYNFGTELTITVTPKDGEATVGRLNLDAYAKYHTDNAATEPGEDATEEQKQSYSNSKKALPLIEALYDYVKVSELYKGGNLVEPTPEA